MEWHHPFTQKNCINKISGMWTNLSSTTTSLHCISSFNSWTMNCNNSSQFLLMVPLKGLQRQDFLTTSECPWIIFLSVLYVKSTHIYKSLLSPNIFQNTEEIKIMHLDLWLITLSIPELKVSRHHGSMINLCFSMHRLP